MDMTEFAQSDSVTLDLVKRSLTKRGVILSAGVRDTNKEGRVQPKILVEIDGYQKFWRPNRTSTQACIDKWGEDSSAWVGKALMFSQGQVNGKDALLVTPQ